MNLAVATEAPTYADILVGRVERPGFDWRLRTSTNNYDYEPYAPVFSSEAEAFTAAARLSAGELPSAAVFAAGSGAFAVVPVEALTLSDVVFSMSRPYDGMGSHREIGIVFDRSDIVALVDANVIVRNAGRGQSSPL
jgi:hypothetical protein